MEAATALQPVASQPVVRDRPPRQQARDREAFEHAMREEGASDAEDQPADIAEKPMATRLQTQALIGRKDGESRHIDVLA